MTHDELLAICDNYSFKDSAEPVKALRAVVELHKHLNSQIAGGQYNLCQGCHETYPCPTIQAVKKELA